MWYSEPLPLNFKRVFISSRRGTLACHFWCCFGRKSWLLASSASRFYTEVDTCCSSCCQWYIWALWLYRSPMAPSLGLWKTSVTAAAIFLCGQSVRWRCCLLGSWHGTHGYLQQQCSLTGKWSRSPGKLSSVSPALALPDCSNSQSDITKCQPPLPPSPPPKKKKLTSLIMCQAKHYSSWFRSAMLALHSLVSLLSLGQRQPALDWLLSLLCPSFVRMANQFKNHHPWAALMQSCACEGCRYEMEIRKTKSVALFLKRTSPRNKFLNKF